MEFSGKWSGLLGRDNALFTIFTIFTIFITNASLQQIIMSYERGAMMLAHSAMIGIAIYLMMRYVFNQSSFVAEDRSIVIAAIVLIYMIMFGHGLPGQINKNLSFLS